MEKLIQKGRKYAKRKRQNQKMEKVGETISKMGETNCKAYKKTRWEKLTSRGRK
jgi:hypothetical protein